MKPGDQRLLEFLAAMTRLVESGPAGEARLLDGATPLMKALVAYDDWLPEFVARSSADRYQQYLLYGDPLDRFSLVSFVWGPGQKTPIHDHTVWGIIGMLRGSECAQHYMRDASGRLVPAGDEATLLPGEIDKVSPTIGDVHVVRNARPDRASISIHLYGGNIGRITRHSFDPATGKTRDFVSGYSEAPLPNPWVSTR